MGPNEKLFKKEYAHELFKIAENDWLTAEVLSKNLNIRKETTLFNVEQSVEKSLKAVLCYLQIPIPFTHDIYAIMQKFDVNDLPPGGYSLHDLTPFASIRRYEEGRLPLTTEEILVSLDAAKKIIQWATAALATTKWLLFGAIILLKH